MKTTRGSHQIRTWVRWAAYSVLAGLLSAGGQAWSASLQISPVTVEFDTQTNAVGLTLRNPGDQPLYGQVRVFSWNQSEGQDALSATDDLIASPPLIQIAPRSEQLVRLVRRNVRASATEQSYRLLIDELPTPSDTPSGGVTIRLRYSVPVFIAGTAGTLEQAARAAGGNGASTGPGAAAMNAAIPPLDWRLFRRNGKWVLRAANGGVRRAQIANVHIGDGQHRYEINKGLLGYALAGQAREWEVPIPEDARLRPTEPLQAMINATSSEAIVSVSPGSAVSLRNSSGKAMPALAHASR
ncbi:fimbrial biogenesis chaperone [Robbsia andropogonis]|uniref:fimbrial biogenesis chaperone n=1 Tax=Robbsia andropogonis TaxID=28092 RepID=UPI0009DCC879|nr:fimbria/pilus periplasmic chaperone [Robbsia andropogonis]MCP1120132.1 fimbria/pilus periplasmic chaperone [Robbsia andropogonis]MCP1130036.1 fimbria/pilus periplasmic chaperone [Robbsia andropogonis]